MKVLGTEQRYLNVNEIRKLIRQYKINNKLKVSFRQTPNLVIYCFYCPCQVENQCVIPDEALALVTGSEPFKINQVISVLQRQNSLIK